MNMHLSYSINRFNCNHHDSCVDLVSPLGRGCVLSDRQIDNLTGLMNMHSSDSFNRFDCNHDFCVDLVSSLGRGCVTSFKTSICNSGVFRGNILYTCL